ncbi:MAG: DUF3592 domain-containing protein [Desulfobulbaceae bacterium]|nr:MAG: DUF3592 domain-containing protein [Desulfobulbaceae bacterium]
MLMQSDNSSQQTRRRRRWGWFLLALGLLAVLLTFVIAAQRFAFLARAQNVPGVVIEMVRMSSGRISQSGGEAYAPRVRFVVGAVEREFVSPFGSYPPAFAVGEAVRVLYDPGDPEHAEVDRRGQLWGPVMVCSVLGVLLGALGGWLVRTPRAARIATRSDARK